MNDRSFVCVVVICFTFFLTAFCVMDDWKKQKEQDRTLHGYEFLLTHPELMKQSLPAGPQVIIPRESATPTLETL